MNVAIQKQGEIIMNTSNEDQDVTFNSAYNAFPEPQTIPSGWDMSEFTSTSQVDPVKGEEDSAES
jgi:hypothetical protein